MAQVHVEEAARKSEELRVAAKERLRLAKEGEEEENATNAYQRTSAVDRGS